MYFTDSDKGVLCMDEPEERCADCSVFCFQKGRAKSYLEELEIFVKTKNFESAVNTIPCLHENNSKKCPIYTLVYIEKVSKIIKEGGAKLLLGELALIIKREFDQMDQNDIGWSGAQEIIRIIKNDFPELEKPLREHLRKSFSENVF